MGRSIHSTSWLPAFAIPLLACAANTGSRPSRPVPVAPLNTSWATPGCLIADTTAPTGDRLFVVGGDLYATATTGTIADCHGPMPVATRPLAVITPIPPFTTDFRELMDAPTGPPSLNRPDVIVTRDPVVLAYAASRADFMIKPLPWTTTYVVVTTTAPSVQTAPSPTERNAIARDAVTADVRGAVEPFTWRNDASCATSVVASASSPRTATASARPVIAFAAKDAIAKQLAERMVSLFNANVRAPWIANAFGPRTNNANAHIAPYPADSLDTILATGRAIATVLPIARDPRTPCTTRDNIPVPLGAIPLVDSRAHVLVRRGSGAAFYVAPDGTLHFFRRPRP